MPWPVFKAPSRAAISAGRGALAKVAQQRASQSPGVSQARTARGRRGQRGSALARLVFFRASGGVDDSLARVCEAACHQQKAKRADRSWHTQRAPPCLAHSRTA